MKSAACSIKKAFRWWKAFSQWKKLLNERFLSESFNFCKSKKLWFWKSFRAFGLLHAQFFSYKKTSKLQMVFCLIKFKDVLRKDSTLFFLKKLWIVFFLLLKLNCLKKNLVFSVSKSFDMFPQELESFRIKSFSIFESEKLSDCSKAKLLFEFCLKKLESL